MKKVLCLVTFLAVATVSNADTVDDIVKRAIAETAKGPCEVQSRKTCPCGPGCTCNDCKCVDGKCQPGCKCDACPKKGSEPLVERCYVIIDDTKVFSIAGVTPTEAMASIRAQGSKVVFINSENTVVDPPSWYKGKVQLSATMVKERYRGLAGGVPTMPATTAPVVVDNRPLWSETYPTAPTYTPAPIVGVRGGITGNGFGFGATLGGLDAGCYGGT